MTKHGVDWSKYLKPGENLSDVSADALRRRRYLALGGTGSSKEEKKALLKREANLKENAAIGQSLDAALFNLLDELRKEAKGNLSPEVIGPLGHGPEREAYYDTIHFINEGELLLRSLNYKKAPRTEANTEDDVAFENQQYMQFDFDYVVENFINLARSIHLSQNLIAFEVKVLEAAIESSLPIPKSVNEELEARKAGIDTYVPPVICHDTPPPVSLPAQKNYQTAEDVFIPGPKPNLTQLAVEQYQQRGHVDWTLEEETRT
jgi:hypothetical protein